MPDGETSAGEAVCETGCQPLANVATTRPAEAFSDAGNAGIPGSTGATAVNWGVDDYDPQSETNPTAAGTRTVNIATIRAPSLGGITPANLTTADHQATIQRVRLRVGRDRPQRHRHRTAQPAGARRRNRFQHQLRGWRQYQPAVTRRG